MKEVNDPGNSHLGDICPWCVIKMSNLNALEEENWSENHVNWSENCGIDIYNKANLLSSVLTEGDFYEEARKWGCQLNPTSITKTSFENPFIFRNIIHFKLKRALNTPKTCGTISFRGFDKISSIRSTQLNWSEQTTSTQNPI